MTYDYEVTLIAQIYQEDEIGNQIPVEEKTTILCGKKSASRSEFYNAAVAGLRPAAVFVIHGYEYSDEQLIEFEGVRYQVIRTYETGFEEIELTCERVAANG